MKRIKLAVVAGVIILLTSSVPSPAAKGGEKRNIPVQEVVRVTEIEIDDSSNPISVLATITVENVTGIDESAVDASDASGTIQGDAYFCGDTLTPDGDHYLPCNGLETPEPNTIVRTTYFLQSDAMTVPAGGSEEFVVAFPRSDLAHKSGSYVFFFQGRLCVVGNGRCDRYLHAVAAEYIEP